MARKLRVAFEGAIYHLTFRGNERRDLFVSDADRNRFLDSLAERVVRYQVRLYLYTLMPNHVHLLVETPLANVSLFMGSLLTSYVAYFNRRHRRSGHLTQSRYHSVLVAGDIYLLRLSRYIHLNPVNVKEASAWSPSVRRARLRSYPWSSYRAYAGLSQPDDFVDYGPLRALTPGRGRSTAARYRAYVEAAVVEPDVEFHTLVTRSRLGLGSDLFVDDIHRRYRAEAHRVKAEDVTFRKTQPRVAPEAIVQAVCRAFDVPVVALARPRSDDWIKPVAAALLTRVAGLTQRETAGRLGVTTGAAVSQQLKRLNRDDAAEARAMLRRLSVLFTI